MRYLYNKFPEANSGQLSWARSRAVCAPALASVAVNRLSLHKMLLVNNVELSIAISKYVPILEATSSEEIIHSGWKHDPPKAISDVLESVLGAMFVDMNYNFEKASSLVEEVLKEFRGFSHFRLIFEVAEVGHKTSDRVDDARDRHHRR